VSRTLFRTDRPVTLVGGGPVPPGALPAALALAPEAIGADGGGDVLLPGTGRFRAVIGDLDSLRDGERLRAAGVPVHHVPEQETTDLEKCLYSVEAPLFLGVGFVGGRIDHDLAAMNALAKNPGKRVILLGPEDVCFRCPPLLEMDLAPGTRVSLFPMGEAEGVASEGLRWSVEGLTLRPGGRSGTSNQALGGRTRVAFRGGPVLAILPAPLLSLAAAALLGPVARLARAGTAGPADEAPGHQE
jgi:thiamine pyrophosphokinase